MDYFYTRTGKHVMRSFPFERFWYNHNVYVEFQKPLRHLNAFCFIDETEGAPFAEYMREMVRSRADAPTYIKEIPDLAWSIAPEDRNASLGNPMLRFPFRTATGIPLR